MRPLGFTAGQWLRATIGAAVCVVFGYAALVFYIGLLS